MPSAIKARSLTLAVLVAGALALAPAVANAAFGIASFSTTVSTPQAGAHADVTTSFALDTDALGNPIGQLRDATITLPQGLVGNLNAIERCPISIFERFSCGPASQVGVLGLAGAPCEGVSTPLLAEAEAGATTLSVGNAYSFCDEQKYGPAGATITVGTGASAEHAEVAAIVNNTTLKLQAPLTRAHAAGEAVTHIATATLGTIPLFNVEPSAGHVATFAASESFAEIFIQVNVDHDGRLTATLSEAPTLFPIQAAAITLWGVPAAPVHNAERCGELSEFIATECGPSPAEPAALMTNPSECSAPLDAELDVSSWQGQSDAGTSALPAMSGCEALTIAPSLTVAPSTTQRDMPAGYEVAVTVPQAEQPYGLATPALQNVSVTLPPGTSLSPAFANGLQACTNASFADSHCPSASRIGTADIDTSLLGEHLTGGIYIATPTASEKYRVFIIASAENATIDLEGQAEANGTTGQVTAVFKDLPQVPFKSLRLDFSGGPTAALANPPTCGAATSTSQITSWGGQMASPSSVFTIGGDAESEACSSPLPFSPSFIAGTTSPLAGGFSPFTVTVSRGDGQQALSSFAAQLPAGLLAMLSRVAPCGESLAASGGCSPLSQIGSTTIEAGAGTQPLDLSGRVYLTGPYKGAPFGLSIVVPMTVGPFDLSQVVIRAQVLIDPHTMQMTIASDPLPRIVDGIPLRLRTVNLTIDRPGFVFNPTSCASQLIAGTVTSGEGASAQVSSPFHVTGCSGLAFAPKLTASTRAKASSEGGGAGLSVRVADPAGKEANIRSVLVDLPSQLRPRLSAIQKACPVARFDAKPASCPSGSRVGSMTVATPVLSAPLHGYTYLVDPGPSAPALLMTQLQSQGVVVELSGAIHISGRGVISTAFKNLPDVPISSFLLELSPGPDSLLGAVEGLCSRKLEMPYTLAAENGALLERTLGVSVDGCPGRRGRRARAH